MDDKTNRVLIEIVKIYVALMFVILMETPFYVTNGKLGRVLGLQIYTWALPGKAILWSLLANVIAEIPC